MASIRPSSQASQRRLPTLTSPGQHQQPSTDSPLFPARKTENRRNRPRQVESPKLCLGPDMTLAGWIQVSASTTAYTVRTGPDTGITTTGHTTPRNCRDLTRRFSACVRSTGAKGGGGIEKWGQAPDAGERHGGAGLHHHHRRRRENPTLSPSSFPTFSTYR